MSARRQFPGLGTSDANFSHLADLAVDRQDRHAILLMAAMLTIEVVWLFGYFFPPINHDVAAILDMSRRWIAGDRIYRDIIDVNTPLVFVIYAIPQLLARILGGSGAHWLVVFVALLTLSSCLGSIALMRRFHGRSYPVGTAAFTLFVPFALIALPPDNSFGQREHLMLILALPWFICTSIRPSRSPASTTACFLIGFAAGIGFSIKPQFLPIPGMVGMYILACIGPKRTFRDPLFWGVIAAIFFHIALATLVIPEYGRSVLPLVLRLYTQIGGSDPISVLTGRVLLPSLIMLAATFAAATTLREGQKPIRVLVVAGLGSAIAAVTQGKGWLYQTYPAEALALLAMTMTVAGMIDRYTALALERNRFPSVLIASAIIGVMWIQNIMFDPPFKKQQNFSNSQTNQLMSIVEKHAINHRILVFSPGINPFYPMINYTDMEMTMRFQTMWPLQGAYAECLASGRLYTPPKDMDPTERMIFDAITHDFITRRPDLIIVDRVPGVPRCRAEVFSYLDYFLQSQEFANAFAEYRTFQEMERYIIYKRG